MPGSRRIPSKGLSTYPFDRQCTVGRHHQSTNRQAFNGHFAVGGQNKRSAPETIGTAKIGIASGQYAECISIFDREGCEQSR
jgi:hypothetical protein